MWCLLPHLIRLLFQLRRLWPPLRCALPKLTCVLSELYPFKVTYRNLFWASVLVLAIVLKRHWHSLLLRSAFTMFYLRVRWVKVSWIRCTVKRQSWGTFAHFHWISPLIVRINSLSDKIVANHHTVAYFDGTVLVFVVFYLCSHTPCSKSFDFDYFWMVRLLKLEVKLWVLLRIRELKLVLFRLIEQKWSILQLLGEVLIVQIKINRLRDLLDLLSFLPLSLIHIPVSPVHFTVALSDVIDKVSNILTSIGPFKNAITLFFLINILSIIRICILLILFFPETLSVS